MFLRATFSCFLVIVTFVFGLALSQDNNVKECLSGQKEDKSHKVSLSCPAGMVISLGEAFFGRNDWGACSLTLDDCTEKVTLFNQCQWRTNCTVFFSGIFIPTCGTYATVLRVYYDCVDESTIPLGEEVFAEEDQPARSNGGPTGQGIFSKGGYLQDPDVTSTENDDVALIAGCATAVVITTIVLVIAIILVVKKLVGSDAGSPHDKGQGCLSFFICTKLGCAKFIKQTPQSSVVEAPPLDPEEEGDYRVAPVGADSAEEVFESARQDSQIPPPEENNTLIQSVTVENEATVVARNTEINSRSSYNENLTQTDSDGREPEQSPANEESSQSSSGPRMDAVAVPNTELSTLC